MHGPLVESLRRARHVAVLTGAGVSAESGLPTFRDALTGLWAQHRPEDLATPEAFERDPRTVWAWYRMRREAEETLEVDYTGEEFTIGFNSRYVLDAVAPVEGEQVVFLFKDSLSPGVIKSVEDEGYCCVIMPMRI